MNEKNEGRKDLLVAWTLAIALIGFGLFLQSNDLGVHTRKEKYILPLGILFLVYALYLSIKKLKN